MHLHLYLASAGLMFYETWSEKNISHPLHAFQVAFQQRVQSEDHIMTQILELQEETVKQSRDCVNTIHDTWHSISTAQKK